MEKINHRNQSWTKQEEEHLRRLAKSNTPTRLIALFLGRTPVAVQAKAFELGISLKPTNQSPYGTVGKKGQI